MTNEYGRIIHRNMRVARRFDLRHEGEWPRKPLASVIDNWAAWSGLVVVLILLAIDVARYGI
jgi:hypothetical protein